MKIGQQMVVEYSRYTAVITGEGRRLDCLKFTNTNLKPKIQYKNICTLKLGTRSYSRSQIITHRFFALFVDQ